ncbi:spore coat protein [Lentibacillus cibarius]|uniref:Spore coat protein n=1 Tax=Lentibacillus cibarius TaxID=2583219 RepID=A0A549YHE7_9BACI|nr:CotY/CotZ family spore coat protein [Lentibacillus cibarius]TRM11278.1 spore coat protein [Lentibacillus cibarius]
MADCVCNIVREIIEAQDQVTNNNDGCCTTSCEGSIQDLLRPEMNNNNNGPDTVPFILYCEGDCNPFIASGVYRDVVAGTNATFFNCLQSPILRAKEFTDENECCVRLELLAPVNSAGDVTFDEGEDVCGFFSEDTGERARGFIATGICITVDLNTFNGIQCLDAVTPLPSSQFVTG